jgi:hypothetical protein
MLCFDGEGYGQDVLADGTAAPVASGPTGQ